MTDQTPANVAASATETGVLTMDNLTVIGVMDGGETPAALVRSSEGEIVRVTPGEIVFGVLFAAIGDDQVVLTDYAGTQHVLTVPRS